MKKLVKILLVFFSLSLVTGCVMVGSGSLNRSITLKSNTKVQKYSLPRGYCLDKSAGKYNGFQQTLVITNCISVNDKDGFYLSRRPIDTIVNLTFTQTKIPSELSEKNNLSSISKNLKFEKLINSSKNKNFIYIDKVSKPKYFFINYKTTNNFKRKEKVRKYFFIIDNKLAIMTIISYKKITKDIYYSFEKFLNEIIKTNS
ncbi:hypothetical protein OA005_00190 [Paracoccaceae bacterium]|nr:hypothetical protein [Paracoccaceae bacterium]